MDVRVGPWRRLSAEELMLLNCGVGGDSWRDLGGDSCSPPGLQGDQSWKKKKNTRRSNQSILKEINLDYSLEGLMLKLKLQYFGHLMQRADSLEKTLMLRKAEGRRKRGRQRMRWLDGITKSITWVWASSRRWWRTRKPGMLQSVGCKESDTTEQLTTTLFHWKSPTGYRKDKNCSVAFSSLPPLPPVSLIFQQVFIYN